MLWLDFGNSTLNNSNLGGYGPDTTGPENLRFTHIGQVNNEWLDLVVTAIGSGYEPKNEDANRVSGNFAMINLLAEREGTLEFCFEDSETHAAVTLAEYGFVLHDFDDGASVRERMRCH